MNLVKEMVVRPATQLDRQGILDLDNSTYSGLDYLQPLLSQFLQDPLANCFVADLQGKVVSLLICLSQHDFLGRCAFHQMYGRRQGRSMGS